MTAKNLSTVTHELIASYGNTAKNVINAYRAGNERVVGYMDQSWAAAVKKTGTRLSPELRGNALATEKKITSLYAQGVVLTSDGAETAVNKAMEMAGKSITQAAANASRFEKATGMNTLNTLLLNLLCLGLGDDAVLPGRLAQFQRSSTYVLSIHLSKRLYKVICILESHETVSK